MNQARYELDLFGVAAVGLDSLHRLWLIRGRGLRSLVSVALASVPGSPHRGRGHGPPVCDDHVLKRGGWHTVHRVHNGTATDWGSAIVCIFSRLVRCGLQRRSYSYQDWGRHAVHWPKVAITSCLLANFIANGIFGSTA